MQQDENQKVTVAVRVRPKLDTVNERYQVECVQKTNDGEDRGIVITQKQDYDVKMIPFTFDRVYAQDSTQLEVYQESCLELVDAALQGYDVTIFTYGQTGSGKTWTVLGKVGNIKAGEDIITEDSGLFLRILSDLFKYKEQQSAAIDVKIYVSILEIYLEEFRDLLADKDKGKNVVLRETDNEVQLQNLTTDCVDSIEEVYNLYKYAEKNRMMASTSMNDVSSRSHCVFFLDIEQVDKNDSRNALCNRICLVDLAGSERVKRSEVEGIHMKEAQAINKSLAALGNVVNGLFNDKKHIPFRDSKLTRILKPSFVGRGKILLIANLSPPMSSATESVSTLRFANRVKEMKAAMVQDDSVDHQKEEELLQLVKINEKLSTQLKIAEKAFQYELQFADVKYKENYAATLDSRVQQAQKNYNQVIKRKEEEEREKKETFVANEVKKLTQETQAEWEERTAKAKQRLQDLKDELESKNADYAAKARNLKSTVEQEQNSVNSLRLELQQKTEALKRMKKELTRLKEQKNDLESMVVEKHEVYKTQIEDYEMGWKKEELLMSIATQNHERLNKFFEEVIALRSEQISYLLAKSKYEQLSRRRDTVSKDLSVGIVRSGCYEWLQSYAEKAVDISAGVIKLQKSKEASPPDSHLQIATKQLAANLYVHEVTPPHKPYVPISDSELQDVLQKSYPYDKKNIIALVVDYLKSGSVLRIHTRGRKGRRFFFMISEDLQNLCWKDENFANMENVTVYTLPLVSIKGILLGQYSDTFRHSQLSPTEDEFYYSFSLLHSSDKTIDLSAVNCFDFEAWILGLGAILNMSAQWGKSLKKIGTAEEEAQLSEEEITLCHNCHIYCDTFIYLKNLVEKLKRQSIDISRGQMRVLSQLDILRSDRLHKFLYRKQ